MSATRASEPQIRITPVPMSGIQTKPFSGDRCCRARIGIARWLSLSPNAKWPTWRVRDKIFAMEKRGDGRVSVWCKAPPGSQIVLVGADPDRFFVPPYVGHKGWIGMRLDGGPDWEEVRAVVARSYRLIAPKRLSALLEW